MQKLRETSKVTEEIEQDEGVNSSSTERQESMDALTGGRDSYARGDVIDGSDEGRTAHTGR
jgi:hypothetical protein